MKIIPFPDKSYSWLQFPVDLKGLHPGRHPHLTIKFFGQTEVSPYAISERLRKYGDRHKLLCPPDFEWESKFWTSPQVFTDHYVLAFTRYPDVLLGMHVEFDIIKDQYIPWSPHITVPQDYYRMVRDSGRQPKELILSFGELELCLGGPNI